QFYRDVSFINYMDYAAGGSYRFYHRRKQVGLRLGVAAHHINKPAQSLLGNNEIRLPTRWTMHGSLSLENFKNPNLLVIPSFKVDMQRSSTLPGVFNVDPESFQYRSISAGVMWALLPMAQYNNRYTTGQGWFMGVWAQSRNLYPDQLNTFTLIGVFGIAVKRPDYNYNLALSYDVNLWGVGPGAGGAAELSLTINLPEMSACTDFRRPPWWCGKYPSPLYH
ncbi:MAG: hypothetical protein AAF399_27000, partial [Bacteroidota bacterium]